MAGCDTNRYARVLCELAGENTNQTRCAIALLGVYKTPQSLPFLYSYATNAEYGAYAMKAIFDIEGVTSSSISVMLASPTPFSQSPPPIMQVKEGLMFCAQRRTDVATAFS